MSKKIQHHWDLDVYKMPVVSAMEIYELSKGFPKEELFSLTDQIRRSSRAVSSAIAEAWRRRKYERAFVNKLNESESEAAETQVWLEYAVRCNYMNRKVGKDLHKAYDHIIGKLVVMGNEPKPWLMKKQKNEEI